MYAGRGKLAMDSTKQTNRKNYEEGTPRDMRTRLEGSHMAYAGVWNIFRINGHPAEATESPLR
jgi:hypothetical protein